MPLSAAEKQKRYRERLKTKPESYEEAKKKQRERYHKNKRLVKDLTPKEKYNANLIWRLRKREQARKKRTVERLLQNTPPSSPQSEDRFEQLDVQNEPSSPTSPQVSLASVPLAPPLVILSPTTPSSATLAPTTSSPSPVSVRLVTHLQTTSPPEDLEVQNEPSSPTPPATTHPLSTAPLAPPLVIPPLKTPLLGPLASADEDSSSLASTPIVTLSQVTSLPGTPSLPRLSATSPLTTLPPTRELSASSTCSSMTLAPVTRPPTIHPRAIRSAATRTTPTSTSLNVSSRLNPAVFTKSALKPSTPLSSANENIGLNQSTESPKQRGRKKIRRDRAKVCRENVNLVNKNEKLKKQCAKYKKKYLRQKNKTSLIEETNNDVKYKILANAINKTLKNAKSKQARNAIKTIFTTAEIQNSRMKTKIVLDSLGNDKIIMDKSHFDRVTVLKKKIKEFFLRDDVTRATAGKKEVITKKGTTVQKRYLLDSIKKLYKEFRTENPETKCSYYYFTKNKPFFVLRASIDAREMCLCKLHANFTYKAKALKKKGITGTDDPSLLIDATVCDVNSKNCMYGECKECKNNTNVYNINKINGTVKWTEWIRKEEKYQKDGKNMKAFRNVREDISAETTDFLKKFEIELVTFRKHVYNIKWQFRNFRQCLQNLRPSECLIVVDFSENYNCKYHQEIQHHHFGGSRNQISLHTVVVYTHSYKPGATYDVHSFCSVSASNIHQPAAIWAHLDPVLKRIRSQFTFIDTVHFFSDGPSTQYRQKQNFYLMSTKLFDYGFEHMTWSFFEAGHGKGPADGVGGYLKNTADKKVANGEDIADVFQFYNKMKDVSKIQLFLIDEKDIIDEQKSLPSNIPRLLGTLKLHQIFSNCRGVLLHRELSCFCENSTTGIRGFCMCLKPIKYDVSGIKEHQEENAAGIRSSDLTLNRLVPKTPEFSDSSDEEVPLQVIKMSKTLQDISNNRQNIYNQIYGSSSEDEQPCTSYGKENCQIENGDFLLVNVYVDITKNKVNTYKYLCKALSDMEDDGEIKVMFLRMVDKCAKRFRLDEKDISYVDSKDIIERLPNPEIVKRGHRTYYVFKYSVNVFEK